MRKVYHLSTCSTCQRIIRDVIGEKKFDFQDIKTNKITETQLDQMKELAGSYEALFSRRAMKYRALGLHEKELSETEYRKHILAEYTFLKRPVVLLGGEIFIGNSKKNIAALETALK